MGLSAVGIAPSRDGSEINCQRNTLNHTKDAPAILPNRIPNIPVCYQCKVCRLVFRYRSALNEHIKIHFEREILVCTYCYFNTISKTSLRRHCFRCHKNTPNCANKCKDNGTGIPQTAHVCTECGMEFCWKSLLDTHIRSKHRREYVHCRGCDKPFVHMSHCKGHERKCEQFKLLMESQGPTSLLDKYYLCELCGQTCSSPSALKTHFRKHTHEKPLICRKCQVGFAQTSNLKRHEIRCNRNSGVKNK